MPFPRGDDDRGLLAWVVLSGCAGIAPGSASWSDAPDPLPMAAARRRRPGLVRRGPAHLEDPGGHRRLVRRALRLRHRPRAAALRDRAAEGGRPDDPRPGRPVRAPDGHLSGPGAIRPRNPAAHRPAVPAAVPDGGVRAAAAAGPHPAAALAGEFPPRRRSSTSSRIRSARGWWPGRTNPSTPSSGSTSASGGGTSSASTRRTPTAGSCARPVRSPRDPRGRNFCGSGFPAAIGPTQRHRGWKAAPTISDRTGR